MARIDLLTSVNAIILMLVLVVASVNDNLCCLVIWVRQKDLAGWHHPTESEVNIKEKRHRNSSATMERRYGKLGIACIHVGTVRQSLQEIIMLQPRCALRTAQPVPVIDPITVIKDRTFRMRGYHLEFSMQENGRLVDW